MIEETYPLSFERETELKNRFDENCKTIETAVTENNVIIYKLAQNVHGFKEGQDVTYKGKLAVISYKEGDRSYLGVPMLRIAIGGENGKRVLYRYVQHTDLTKV